jgi:hypothetical protein
MCKKVVHKAYLANLKGELLHFRQCATWQTLMKMKKGMLKKTSREDTRRGKYRKKGIKYSCYELYDPISMINVVEKNRRVKREDILIY